MCSLCVYIELSHVRDMFNGTWLCMTVRVDYMHWRRDEHDDERSLLMANILYIQFKNCRKFHFVFQYYSCKAVYSRLPYALHNVKGVVKSLKLIWWWFLRDYITSEIVFKFAPVVGDGKLEEDTAGRERVRETERDMRKNSIGRGKRKIECYTLFLA